MLFCLATMTVDYYYLLLFYFYHEGVMFAMMNSRVNLNRTI